MKFQLLAIAACLALFSYETSAAPMPQATDADAVKLAASQAAKQILTSEIQTLASEATAAGGDAGAAGAGADPNAFGAAAAQSDPSAAFPTDPSGGMDAGAASPYGDGTAPADAGAAPYDPTQAAAGGMGGDPTGFMQGGGAQAGAMPSTMNAYASQGGMSGMSGMGMMPGQQQGSGF